MITATTQTADYRDIRLTVARDKHTGKWSGTGKGCGGLWLSGRFDSAGEAIGDLKRQVDVSWARYDAAQTKW